MGKVWSSEKMEVLLPEEEGVGARQGNTAEPPAPTFFKAAPRLAPREPTGTPRTRPSGREALYSL